ncbi:7-cyano-7-deazaguanine synthase [Desulfovibrio aminophilus]|uniref:7-cyano-7-deazaguanine synthase n=1 Tax=Desulfovibrio aminophilus TaxID=81425 RepID=UPI003392F461
MSIVTLVSGGLDSTLVAALIRDEGLVQFPLFIDYHQRARDQELAACHTALKHLSLPEPEIADLAGYGKLIPSGLTDPSHDVFEEAFLPGRNLLFALTGAAYACRRGADAVAMGLLTDETSLFPDQTRAFLRRAEGLLSMIMGRKLRLLAPLKSFTKQDVIRLAAAKGISGTYSCHVGGKIPCGFCISCREFKLEEA